jgi:hypothetical protein
MRYPQEDSSLMTEAQSSQASGQSALISQDVERKQG